LNEGDELISVKGRISDSTVLIVGTNGNVIRFDINRIRSMNKRTLGLQTIQFDDKEDYVAGFEIISKDIKEILVVSSTGFCKRVLTELLPIKKSRTGKGYKLISKNDKAGKIVGVESLLGNKNELLAVTKTGKSIRTDISKIKLMNRTSIGMRLQKIEDDSIIDIKLV
jgi:DNA gyrase subunit A